MSQTNPPVQINFTALPVYGATVPVTGSGPMVVSGRTNNAVEMPLLIADDGALFVTGALTLATQGAQGVSGSVSVYTQGAQLVSGSVSVAGGASVFTQGPQAVTGSVSVFTQGAQLVSGSVSTYTQGIQAVSGTVFVTSTGSLPVAIQGTVPLPSNAAQETGGNLAAINTKIPSQGIQAAAACLPVVPPTHINYRSAGVTPPIAGVLIASGSGRVVTYQFAIKVPTPSWMQVHDATSQPASGSAALWTQITANNSVFNAQTVSYPYVNGLYLVITNNIDGYVPVTLPPTGSFAWSITSEV